MKVKVLVTSDSAIPWTVAHQTPLSVGFSRQEYWSGLPFPFSRESSRSKDRTQVSHSAGGFLDSLLSKPPGKPKNPGVGSLALLQELPDPGGNPGSPTVQVDSLPAELPGKPSGGAECEMAERQV